MTKALKRISSSKRQTLSYVVIFLWAFMGILGIYFDADFKSLATYFISLTGFILAYIFGESVRKSSKTSLFLSGKVSRRELIIYITTFLWAVVGGLIIVKEGDLIGVSAYFAALTPFVGSYIISETYKEDNQITLATSEEQQLNS